MSRLAKKPLFITAGVSVAVNDGALTFKGPKGELKVGIPPQIQVEVTDSAISVKHSGALKQTRADAGTFWSLSRNSMQGVTAGFEKVLEIEGVGYRATLEGDTLSLSLGYVNPVKVKIPAGLAVAVEKNTIKISGIDKQQVGHFAASVRKLKKPEPYKGKGIRYHGEVVRRKVGKKAATTA